MVAPLARALATLILACALPALAAAEESNVRIGALDAVLTIPDGVERPPVALLFAGSGSIDRDGNGPQLKPATLKKLAEQLASRGTSPDNPAAWRMNRLLSGGARSTRPRPMSRTVRSSRDSFENKKFSELVATPIAMVSNRRQR